MTISEAKDILIDRLGWRDDKTISGFTLSAPNLITDSGRYLQAEHSSVTLENIRDCQPIVDISETDFNLHLVNLTEQVAFQVLSDVFERDFIDDNLFNLYSTSFDNLMSLRTVIVVAETIMTSTRSNRIERLGDDFVGKLNYDIFRDAPNKFAIRNLNYKHSMGITTRYAMELGSIQRRFGNQRNMIRTITKGQSFITDINELNNL
jgi:hypothetical protein